MIDGFGIIACPGNAVLYKRVELRKCHDVIREYE